MLNKIPFRLLKIRCSRIPSVPHVPRW